MAGYIPYQPPNEDWLNTMFQLMGFAMVGAFAVAVTKAMIGERSPAKQLFPKTKKVRFDRADIDSAIAAAQRLQSEENLYVFATYLGYVIERRPPPSIQPYIIVHPDGTTKTVMPHLPAVVAEPILIPLRDAPEWVRTEWGRLHGRTRPEVQVHRTEVATIHPPTFEYAVRDIVAHKGGRTMRRYVPSYDTLLAVTPEQRALYFGGAVKLGPDDAIAVMDFWGPRYQMIDLYIHPLAYEPPRLIAPELTERQMKILATIRGYIGPYRKEVLRVHKVTTKELDELRRYGLIDARGAITTMGRNIVSKEDPWTTYKE